ncbi:patatin-like phospholipase family protein [Polycladidibacter stylochi]|uniref:patatin-like phospholipase family protein n=1 Tax=Polycladidibacter stylochi TaxID=1807766 RepID=UPI00082A885F|nr:patatin-like phospholipase family protein [Pseudovibrio stylochi]
MQQNFPKKISLALQGGGAHGAFTWGALDWLLEHDELQIEAISGTSAGAMNAVALIDGFAKNGSQGARESLSNLWHAISELGKSSPFQRTFYDMLTGNWSLENSPVYSSYDLLTRIWSPYQLNPLDINPLRDLLAKIIDFDRVKNFSTIDIHIAATNIRSGKIKVFKNQEISLETLMASCCLPQVFKAVEIGGEAYWDGGYMGNPPLFPLYSNGGKKDILLIQINPVKHDDIPKTAFEIGERLNEITFNSTLLRELRAIHFVTRLLDEGKLSHDEYTQVYMHRIEASTELSSFGASSKLNPQWEFIEKLFKIGRDTAESWYQGHSKSIGNHSSLDLKSEFE